MSLSFKRIYYKTKTKRQKKDKRTFNKINSNNKLYNNNNNGKSFSNNQRAFQSSKRKMKALQSLPNKNFESFFQINSLLMFF